MTGYHLPMRFLPALALLAGCMAPEVPWQPMPAINRPAEEVLGIVRELLLKQGYTVTTEEPFEGGTRLLTAWNTQLSPHWRQGKRRQIEISVVPVSGGCTLRLRTFLEINENLRHSSSPAHADWLPSGSDDDVTLRLREMIRYRVDRPSMEE